MKEKQPFEVIWNKIYIAVTKICKSYNLKNMMSVKQNF